MKAPELKPSRAGRIIASPRARRLLAKLGIDPRQVRASGPDGRIVVQDLAHHLKPGAEPACLDGVSSNQGELRRIIAQRTADSFARIPHFYLRAEADVSALLALRYRLKSAEDGGPMARATLTDFVLKAAGLALSECPEMNRVWGEQGPVHLPGTDVGLVVSVAGGLMVPVVRDVARLALAELVRERDHLVAAARVGQLRSSEISGGSLTVSNIGGGRVDEFAGVIQPGQCSLLTMGSAALRPFVLDGVLAARTTVRFCLAVDHRVVDGKPAAAFLNAFVSRIEAPDFLNPAAS